MAVVVAANVYVLIGVAIDRAGGVVQKIELTEQELPIWGTSEDNTGVAVRLSWSPYRTSFLERPALDQAKLAELGFDCSVPAEDREAESHYRRLTLRRLWMVLEYDGPAWREWAGILTTHDEKRSSRLILVEAGQDAAVLRAKYPDQSHYLIVPALIRATLRYAGSKPQEVVGTITGPLAEIHVPHPYARTLAGLRGKPYHLTLCYGKRYEPWICGCRP
jgi:hypothetical protein